VDVVKTDLKMPSKGWKRVRSPFGDAVLIGDAVRRVDKQILNQAITTLTTHAESYGFTTQQIDRLVSVLVQPDGLDRPNTSRLVHSMIPNEKVDEDIAVKIIACIGLGEERAPLQIQVYLLAAGIC